MSENKEANPVEDFEILSPRLNSKISQRKGYMTERKVGKNAVIKLDIEQPFDNSVDLLHRSGAMDALDKPRPSLSVLSSNDPGHDDLFSSRNPKIIPSD